MGRHTAARRGIAATAMAAGLVLAGAGLRGNARAAETANEFPWQLGFHVGQLNFEGDEPVKDAAVGCLHLGYDYSEAWTFEAIFLLAPSLKGTTRNSYGQSFNRLTEATDPDGPNGPGRGVVETSAWGLGLEAMYHITRWKRVDPYFGCGLSFIKYTDDFSSGGGTDPTIRAGAGILYHFNDEWAIRADWRGFFAGTDTEANMLTTVGVVWTIGAHVKPEYAVSGGAKDTDGDGLTDVEETEVYRTDPRNPDTDGDKLTDYQEVKVYHTDPLVVDTDFDLLGDGDEVLTYKTDPRVADTDKGGVIDGHEVLEDGTNPLNPADDLVLYSLNIEFDTDQSIIKPRYFPDIDIIGKVMTRAPQSTAVIEGHADKRRTSLPDHNLKLSEARAKAVLEYLVRTWKIDRSRLQAKGFGFSRPVAPNDPVNGNQKNRRTDIYIRGANKDGNNTDLLPAAPAPAVPPVIMPPAPVSAIVPAKPVATKVESAGMAEVK